MGFLDIAILLNITVGPTKAAAMYLALTAEADPKLKRQIAVRTVVTATAILLLFALVGQSIIGFFHIGIPALLISGGLILFVFALQLVLGEDHDDAPKADRPAPSPGLAVYPLAMPLMASPQGIVAIVTITVERPDMAGRLLLLGLLLLQMAGNLVTLLFAEKIFSWISPAIFKVVMRIFGLLLCGLAVQLVIFGLQVLKVIPGTPG